MSQEKIERKIIKLSHRGAWGYEPEHTISSFKKALEFDIDFIEMDVGICKTGEVILFHDVKIDRTTNGRGFLTDKTFDELKTLDAGKGQKIPTLEETLNLINRKTKVNIELKGEGSADAVSKIINKYITGSGWEDNDFLISSFNHPELIKFHALNPMIKIGAIIAGIPLNYGEFAEKLGAYSVHISKEFINRELVDDIQKRGMKAFVYTVNDPDFIDRIKSLGVDGIFSDYPDRL